MSKKLDLSRLTDEEAKHVWEVIQRDMELRKKEESRLGDLKAKIQKEGTKRELLTSQSNLTESYCIHCLQPFKFLINSRRQCADCQLYTCKACSRYNKKERSWVCDPCRMSRVLKIGSLDWYHNNVRSRFKHFGSAKVMRSLYKRLNESGSQMDLRDFYDGHEEEDTPDVQRYRTMRKTKRLLSVHPLDFDMDQEYSTHSRRPSVQQSRQGKDSEYSTEVHFRYTRRKTSSLLCFSDEGHIPDQRMMRTRSLSKISPSQRYTHGELDSSEEEEAERYPMYQLPARRRSRASSQENVHQGPPQMTELTKRMVAIESLLTRLEQKMIDPVDHVDSPLAVDLEEEKLSRKLKELTGNISDKGLSSEEEEVKLPKATKETMKKNRTQGEPALVSPLPQERVLSSSSDEQLSETQKVYLTAGKSYSLERKLRSLEQSASNRYCGHTDSELSELEDKVALAAAKVQNTESEVSDIENRIAALSASGMSEKLRKKVRRKVWFCSGLLSSIIIVQGSQKVLLISPVM
uniref:Melanophilin a n=1 Tax=Scleropages formosus TaxID=113540 RepID=A0A8C9V071_SCLFO